GVARGEGEEEPTQSRQPPALGLGSLQTLRMCSSHTREKAVPPTAMPITAATKAAYEKSITAFMGVPFRWTTPCISAAQDGRARAQPWPTADQLWRTSGSGLLPRPALPRSGIFPRMAKTVAIVEDDAAIRANYADLLKKHGYQVSAFPDRGSALAAFRSRLPDLALLDIGLAGEPDGGFALCRELRALSAALPIIFLTARDSDFDVISRLRMGADDYMTKDAGMPHLLART